MTTQETFQLSTQVAEVYEATFVPAFFAQWAPRLLDAAGVTEGQRVLDVACGTGIVARRAAQRVGPTGTTVGVDISEAMLSVARRVGPDIEWRHGDAAKLPCADAEFDVAVSQMAMMFFPDPVRALREMRRAVRPGGVVAVLIPSALPANRPYELFVDIVTRHAGQAARSLVTAYFVLGDPGRLSGLFTEAGLRVETATNPEGESRFGSADDMVTIEIDSTPLAERLDATSRDHIITDCREALAPWRSVDGSVSFPFVCNLVVAKR